MTPEAHLALKRSTAWVGYKVHLTETCEPETPNLITDVQAVVAPLADWDSLPVIHQGLAKRDLLPSQHLVDSGYVDAALLVASRRDFGIDLVGPPRGDQHWQAREQTGFSAEHFHIDWEQQRAICPEGRTSVSWSPVIDNRRTEVIKIRFSEKDCSQCPSVTRCVRSSKKYPRRLITVRQQAAYEALRAARQREKTRAFVELYANRSGVEGTISQGVRTCRMRRTRYRCRRSNISARRRLKCSKNSATAMFKQFSHFRGDLPRRLDSAGHNSETEEWPWDEGACAWRTSWKYWSTGSRAGRCGRSPRALAWTATRWRSTLGRPARRGLGLARGRRRSSHGCQRA